MIAVAAPLGVQDTADMATVARVDERDLEADELVEIAVQSPVENPRRFHAEDGRGCVARSLEFGHARLRI